MSALDVPGWVHPLRNKVFATSSGTKFGASRSGDRPPECGKGHCGNDLMVPVGTPVFAAHDGEVVTAQRNEVAGGRAGRFILINHAGGAVRTSYIHLDKLDVNKGDKVRAGQRIGTVGLTGVSYTAPHLHFAVRVSGRYVDPAPHLKRWSTAPRSNMVMVAAAGLLLWLVLRG